MTLEELRETSTTLFDSHLGMCKQGEPINPGFWMIVNSELVFHPYGPTLSQLLNSGEGKDFLFACVRHWVEQKEATAVFFITEANMLIMNEMADQDAVNQMIQTEGLRATEKAGYGKIVQVLWLNSMTPEWVNSITRKFETMVMNGDRRLIFHGELETSHCPIEQFQGRMKMFGPITEAEVQIQYDRLAQHIENISTK